MTSLMGLAHGKGKGHAATSPNLIANGSFVGHADGWYPVYGFSLASWQSGSLVVGTDESHLQAITAYRPGGAPTVALGGLTELDLVGTATTDDPDATVQWVLSFATDPFTPNLGSTTLDAIPVGGGTPTPFVYRGIAVPEGVAYLHLQLWVTGSDTDLRCEIDDVYVGPPGMDAPPYPVAAVPLGNRFSNGTFTADIADWFSYAGATLTHEAGRLKVETPGNAPGEGVYSSSVGLVVVPGEHLVLQFDVEGPADLQAMINWNGDGGASDITYWTDTVGAIPETTEVPLTVPAGAVLAYPEFITSTDQAITFYLDNVSLTAAP